MDNNMPIACVTGATGMIGRRIVEQLLNRGYQVRVLSRKQYPDPQVISFRGGLEDSQLLNSFLAGAEILFHCAAELKDEAKMWEVNYLGTRQLLDIVHESNIKYLCYLSSAGVIGLTDSQLVDEKSDCNPQNKYESSKWEAEKLVSQGVDGCKIVILRPTNVIDDQQPGALLLPIRQSWLDIIKVFIKGGECAHIIYAEDVAAAAVFFITYPLVQPECFFVANDDDPLNTFAGLWSLYKSYQKGNLTKNIRPTIHLPLFVPHFLRFIFRGRRNYGDIRYSSKKLLATGFKFPVGLFRAVNHVHSFHTNKN